MTVYNNQTGKRQQISKLIEYNYNDEMIIEMLNFLMNKGDKIKKIEQLIINKLDNSIEEHVLYSLIRATCILNK